MINIMNKINKKICHMREKYMNHFSPNYQYTTHSYSQYGEDLLIAAHFENMNNGFFVDLGAHHPFRFSNTNIFYDKGWRGINVEPNPDAISLFDKYRDKDINLQCGIGLCDASMIYYMYKEPAFNTFSKKYSEESPSPLVKKLTIPIRKLSDILDQNLPSHISKIDLLNIDIEGFELEALKSNNWNKYIPQYILLENGYSKTIQTDLQDECTLFLKEKKYSIVSKHYNTLLFQYKE